MEKIEYGKSLDECIYKMTSSTRLEMIRSALLDSMSSDGTNEAVNLLDELEPTINELLAIAFAEDKLPDDFDISAMLKFPEVKENSCKVCKGEGKYYMFEICEGWFCDKCLLNVEKEVIGDCQAECDLCN